MKIKKDYTYSIWQLAIFKTALLSGGVVIGSLLSEHLKPYWLFFAAVWLVSAVYIVFISYKK